MMIKRVISQIIALLLLGVGLVGSISAESSPILRPVFGTNFGGNDGEVVLHSSITDAHAAAEQPDGKIIVAGRSISSNQILTVQRYHANGLLDLSFGTAGHSDIFVANGVKVNAVAIQPDGRIVIAGWANPGQIDRDLMVVRLLADGSADTTFNGSGRLIWDAVLSFSDEVASDVAILADGKIALIGYVTSCYDNHGDCGREYDTAAWRLLTDGSFDTTFDGDGLAQINVREEKNDQAKAFVVQSDGKLVVVGDYIDSDTVTNLFVARLTTNGSLDTSFDNDGLLTFDDESRSGSDILVQSNGKIMFSGTKLLGRLHTDGSLDTTFDDDGLIDTTNSQLPGKKIRLNLRNDNQIYVTGRYGTQRRIALLDSAGALDPTFDEDGYVQVGPVSEIREVVRLQNGKLLLLLRHDPGTGAETILRRYYADSMIDEGGRMAVDYSADNVIDEAAYAVVVHDNQIYVAGTVESATIANVDEFILQRFSNKGVLDTTFTIAPVAGFTPADIAVDYGGNVIVVGKHDNNPGFHVRRYLADGSLDWEISDLLGGSSVRATVALFQEDQVLVGGTRDDDFAIIRINNDGSTDMTFGMNGSTIYDMGGKDTVTALALAPDGKIMLQGLRVTGPIFNTIKNAVVMRFTAEGIFDNTYNLSVLAIDNNVVPNDMVVQPDGKVVSVGEISRKWALWRLNANGNLDTAFGNNAVKMIFTQTSEGNAVYAQTDGTIISVGCHTAEEQDVTVVTRLTSSGAFDTTFSNDGIANIINGTRSECARAMAPINNVDSTQDLIVVGDAELGTNQDAWTLMRLRGTDVLPLDLDGQLQNNGTEVELSWNAVGYFDHELWHSNLPYAGYSNYVDVVGTAYTETDMSMNYYYEVYGRIGNDLSFGSNRIGVFSFDIVPGS